MKKIVLACLLFAPGIAARADVIWDQSRASLNGHNIKNIEFNDFYDYSSYVASDVFSPINWTITKITVWTDRSSNAWPEAVHFARVYIFPRVANLPRIIDDPRKGRMVRVTVVRDINNGFLAHRMTADGLSLRLPRGRNWVGLTPVLAFGSAGQCFRYEADNQYFDLSAFRNPGGRLSLGTDWFPVNNLAPFGDATIKIEGVRTPPWSN